jgi:hypothetical protein
VPKSRKRRQQKTRRPASKSTRTWENAPLNVGRTTVPLPHVRFRPTWHKVIGGIQLALAVTLAMLNFAEYNEIGILPGGHSEFYFLAAIMTALASSWWFGWFDRPQ